MNAGWARRLLGAVLAAAPWAVDALASGSSRTPRIEQQRGHAICPLPGRDEQALLIDTRDEWRALVSADETRALGRKVRWSRERVLLYAMPQQPTLGIQVAATGVVRTGPGDPPQLGLRVVRPAPDAMAATALSRPCVFVALSRGAWREVRLTDAAGNAIGVARLGAARGSSASAGAAPPPFVLPSLIEPGQPDARRAEPRTGTQ